MERIKRASLYIFLGLLAYMPLHIFISTWLGTTLGILEIARVFKDILLIVGFFMILGVSLRESWLKKLLSDRLILLILCFFALTSLLAIVKPTDIDAEILGVVYGTRFLVFFLYAILLARTYKPEWLVGRVRQVVLIASVPVLIFGFVQYMWLPSNALSHAGYSRSNGVLPIFLIDEKPDLERVMSTLRDPNSYGSYLLIILSLAGVLLLNSKDKKASKWLVALISLAALNLYFTFSRSAWVGAVVTLACLVFLQSRHKQRFRISKKVCVAVLVLVAVFLSTVYISRNTYFVKNVIFHADESTVLEDPNQLRARFFQESLGSTSENPLGYGPGTAGLASIRNNVQGTILNENYYLQVTHEVGILGLILFIGIIFIIAQRLYKKAKKDPLAIALLASLAGLAVTNLFVHIWANEAVAYTWWGLAGLCVSLVVPSKQHEKEN